MLYWGLLYFIIGFLSLFLLLRPKENRKLLNEQPWQVQAMVRILSIIAWPVFIADYFVRRGE